MFPFFAAVTVTPSLMLIVVLGLVAGAGLVAWLGKEDGKLIKARKTAQNVASFLNELGLTESADFFEDFAVNDVPGMLSSAEAVVKIANNPTLRTTTALTVVQKFIAAAVQSGNTAVIQQLQQMLGGNLSAASQPLGQAALQQLAAALNPNQIPTGASVQIVHQQPATLVQPAPVVTTVSHQQGPTTVSAGPAAPTS